MDPFCREFNSARALQQAKSNVEHFYAVVGVLEELDKTYAVMEQLLPTFFRGLRERLPGGEADLCTCPNRRGGSRHRWAQGG